MTDLGLTTFPLRQHCSAAGEIKVIYEKYNPIAGRSILISHRLESAFPYGAMQELSMLSFINYTLCLL